MYLNCVRLKDAKRNMVIENVAYFYALMLSILLYQV